MPDRPKTKTSAPPARSFPPSLNKISGMSEWQFQEQQRLGRVEEVIRRLPLRGGAEPFIANFARDLCETFLFAKRITATKRKTRVVSPAGLKRELRFIETGAQTLARRLKDAHANVFQAWADASCPASEINRQKSTQEWLQLRRLLEDAEKRARRAAQTGMPKSSTSESRGRPSDEIANAITGAAATAFEELTKRVAVRSTDRDSGRPQGLFHNFLTDIFAALDIESSPDAANMRLQSERKRACSEAPGRSSNKKTISFM
jgi:hypothetical protein